MNKKKWISAEVIDLAVEMTEAMVTETPNHDLAIIGYTPDGTGIHGHS